MPTSDERREVAEKLRRASACGEGISCCAVDRVLGLRYDEDYFGDVFTCESVRNLADLIDPQERTCRILQAYGDESEELDHRMEEIAGTPEDTVACICQSCGHEFRYDRMVRPRFCPHCGARVTSVGEGR